MTARVHALVALAGLVLAVAQSPAAAESSPETSQMDAPRSEAPDDVAVDDLAVDGRGVDNEGRDKATVARIPTDPPTRPPALSLPAEPQPAPVFADESDDAVLERALDYIRNVTTMTADFVQTSPSGVVSSGKVWLRRPGQMRFEYDGDDPLLIVATQGNVYVRDNELETTDFYPLKRTPLRFLLSKKVEADDLRVLSIDRGVSSLAVTLAAGDEDGEETGGELSVIFDAPSLSLREWVVRDAQNGVTVVTLRNAVAGRKLASKLFRAPEAGGSFLDN